MAEELEFGEADGVVDKSQGLVVPGICGLWSVFCKYVSSHSAGQPIVLKFFVYFLWIFIRLLVILLLSLCFGFPCLLLTLLQLGYIIWCFIVYFRIIFGDLTFAFHSGT